MRPAKVLTTVKEITETKAAEEKSSDAETSESWNSKFAMTKVITTKNLDRSRARRDSTAKIIKGKPKNKQTISQTGNEEKIAKKRVRKEA